MVKNKLTLPPKNIDPALYDYLYQMVEMLNLQEQANTADNTVATGASVPREGEESRETARLDAQYDALKSLVIKTAQTTVKELEQLSARLTGSYVAISDFGKYMEQLNAYIEANPDSITQYYSFYSELKNNIGEAQAAFDRYTNETEGYIKTGIVYYDEGGMPVLGVAVGQNLTAREVTLPDGTTQTEIDQTAFRATFTAKKLSFWQDDLEVAYVSNNRLYITGITVLDKMTLGEWEVSTSNGMAFKWIGG